MTYIELVVSFIVLSYFIAGLGQAALPAFRAWKGAAREYRNARALEFVAESFKRECGKKDRDIKGWEKAVSIVPQLESYKIEEFQAGGEASVLRLECVIGGEKIEILGLYEP
jgi:type II secretory pathway pseudopilin PulG